MSRPRPHIVTREQARSQQIPNNLPAQPTRVIGREAAVEDVRNQLAKPDLRLLTLTGPGGVGKTRLGLQVAAGLLHDAFISGSRLDTEQTFTDGIYFVSLAAVSDSNLVISTITQALELRGAEQRPLLELLKSYLQGKQILLILDNFEQVVTASPLLSELLAESPGVKIMVTSREMLHLYGEYDYPVPPLSLPDPNMVYNLDALSQYEAVALFVQRAQAVSPDFQLTERNAHAVAEICQRLDGLPLAIELAVARILVLPPEELLARLKISLRLLTGGARNLPERQRTLQATIDWSYNLLDSDEQALFRRLGVFVGGCTLNAIEEVCSSIGQGEDGIDILDAVTSLVGKSLLQRQEEWGKSGADGEPRFIMLETIREYAREKLTEVDSSKGGALDSTADRHCEYFLQFAENAEQGTVGSETPLWMGRLDAEQNNLRAALEWSLSRDGGAEKGLRLAGALARYWDSRGYFSEGRQWCERLLSQPEPAQPNMARSKVLRALARMTWQQSNFTEAHRIYKQSLGMSRTLGDDAGVAASLLGLGSVAMWQGDYKLSRSLYEECLAAGRRLGSPHLISSALAMIGVILMRQEDYRAAQLPFEEALAINRELGDDTGIADTLIKQGSVAVHLGEYQKAKALIEESLGIARDLGVGWIIAISLARLGMIALRQGDTQQAELLLTEGLGRAQDSGLTRWSQWYLVGLAEVARLRGMIIRAAKLIGASEGVLSGATAHYEPATHGQIEQTIASVSAELDHETFARLQAEGRAMTHKEAIAYAMESSSGATSAERVVTDSHAKAGIEVTTEGRKAYPDGLTEREVEVLRLIAVGKSNLEIGQELVLSRRTVERHISNIYQKIGSSGKVARAAASAYALRHGLAT
ncbi:MAG: tetratricopeptide repeat protein [Chloroflexota bacterium]